MRSQMNLCGLMAFLNWQHPQNKQERGAATFNASINVPLERGPWPDHVRVGHFVRPSQLLGTQRWNATGWPQQRCFSLMWFRLSEWLQPQQRGPVTCDMLQKRPFSVWARHAAGSTHPGEKGTQWKPQTCSDAQRLQSTQDGEHSPGWKRTHPFFWVTSLLPGIFAHLYLLWHKKVQTLNWDIKKKSRLCLYIFFFPNNRFSGVSDFQNISRTEYKRWM